MNEIIDDREYVIAELKKYPSNIGIIDPIEIGYNLSDKLKEDDEIIKLILDSVYATYFGDKMYTLKGLYMKYIEFYKENLSDIYFRELDLTRILPEYLKSDEDICKFFYETYVNNEKADDNYSDSILKMFTDCDSRIDDVANDKQQKSLNLYLKAFNYMKSTKEYRQLAIDSFIEYLNYGISSKAIKYDIEYIIEYAYNYHLLRCYRYIANMYLKGKKFDNALTYYDKAINAFPYYHSPYIGKADTLVKMDKIDEAIVYLNQVLEDKRFIDNKGIFKAASKTTYDGRVLPYTYNSFIKRIKDELKIVNDFKGRNYHYKPRNN